MSDFVKVTAACPETLADDAGHLAMALGRCADDAKTYANVNWQDGTGAKYACAAWSIPAEWIKAAQSPLQRPDWDSEKLIDMDAAAKVQAGMVFSPDPVPASPDRLTAIAGGDPWDVLAAMGLAPIPFKE